MTSTNQFAVGSAVLIAAAWAAGRHGTHETDVPGVVIGHSGTRDLYVARQDKVPGSGPEFSWVCPPDMLTQDTVAQEAAQRAVADAAMAEAIDHLASTDPEEGYAYDSGGSLHKLNDGARYASPLPNDSAKRKELPIGKVFFGMFPAAMVGVTENVMAGNVKHLGADADIPRHDRSKSADHLDCIMRHAMDGDVEAVATRALMWLQEVREAEGAPRAPRAFNFPDQG